MPVPTTERAALTINFEGREATIKDHVSLLVYYLLKNDIRLNALFENLKLNRQIENITENRFEISRKIDLLFTFLYKLTDSEIELVLAEFNKQYSKNDLVWFKNELKIIHLKEN